MLATKKFEDLPHPDTLNVFFGNMMQLRKERIKFFVKQKKEIGNIYRIKVPTRKVVVLTDPDWIKYVLVDNNKNYTKSFAYDSIRLFLGNGLLTSEGEFWKRQRRLTQPAFHKEKLALMFQNMVEQTEKCIQNLEKYADTDQSVNLSKELYKLTLDIVNSTLFYSEIDNTTDAIYKLVSEGSEYITKRIDNPLQLPNWVPTPHNIKESRVLHSMDKLFFSIIERRRKQKEQHQDLLSMLMEARDEETGEVMSNKQLRDEILTIFVAGHETTQIALGWTFFLLTQNPDKTKILTDEIKNTLNGETPTPQNIRGLHYLKQVVDESMRCFPPAWIMGRRTIEKDVIDGYEIPTYTNVIMPIYVVHHDESVWDDPFDFIPERFNIQNIKEKHKYSYFPFGGGPRLCIGNNFAIQEMQVCLAMILQKFNIEVDENFVPELDPLVTLRPKYPIYAKVWKRV
ncbi:MAG: cytochrome [Bacteroidota bacterium]|nr:cytochrome [Bacteroidota bacterium]